MPNKDYSHRIQRSSSIIKSGFLRLLCVWMAYSALGCADHPVNSAPSTAPTMAYSDSMELSARQRAVQVAVKDGLSRPAGPFGTSYQLSSPDTYVLVHEPDLTLAELASQLESENRFARNNAYELLGEIFFANAIDVSKALDLLEKSKLTEKDAGVLDVASHFEALGRKVLDSKKR